MRLACRYVEHRIALVSLLVVIVGACEPQWRGAPCTPCASGPGIPDASRDGTATTTTFFSAPHSSGAIPILDHSAPPPMLAPPDILAIGQRMKTTQATGLVNLASLTVPGYYTLVLFSAEWCAPCEIVWKEMPSWVARYPNLVVIDVDVGRAREDGSWPEVGILKDLELSEFPAAVLLGPFGQTTKRLAGLEQVRSLFTWLETRKHQTVLPFPRLDAFDVSNAQQSNPPQPNTAPPVVPPQPVPDSMQPASQDAGLPVGTP